MIPWFDSDNDLGTPRTGAHLCNPLFDVLHSTDAYAYNILFLFEHINNFWKFNSLDCRHQKHVQYSHLLMVNLSSYG